VNNKNKPNSEVEGICSNSGSVYALIKLLPYLQKYKSDPVTGKKATLKADYFTIHLYRNNEREYHCPATFKVFNPSTKIAVNKVTGNVYAYDAIEKLNIKVSNLRDLISDEPFKRDDIIIIQDPTDLTNSKYNFASFHHIVHDLKVNKEEEEALRSDPKYYINLNDSSLRALQRLKDVEGKEKEKEEKRKEQEKEKAGEGEGKGEGEVEEKKKAIKEAHYNYSTGKTAASFTSTTLSIQTKTQLAVKNNEEVMFEYLKKKQKKGYVRIVTNKGDLNFELHVDLTPKTCF